MTSLIEKYRIEESDPPVPPGQSLWLRFHQYEVNIIKTDEGIVVDVWKGDEIAGPVATTFAFDNE